jgi:lipopolysaccharide/colanic/teichoic acid biosynthesis glycosyltransferase
VTTGTRRTEGSAAATFAPMLKRAVDILIAAVLVVLTLPVVLVAAIGSAIALRAWPFFVQRRIGWDGMSFRFVKIRTLPTSTPKYLLKDELDLEGVPRFTRALRVLHFDELPQLFLVLTGRMSLVGPRPEMISFHDLLEPDFARERGAVRPGCTGLWQISWGCAGLLGESPEFDRFYLRHQRLRLDLWIVWRTALLMLGLRSLVGLEDVPTWAADHDLAPSLKKPGRRDRRHAGRQPVPATLEEPELEEPAAG